MKKEENIKIIQIAIDGNEQPYTFKVNGYEYKSNVLGLGDDGKVYSWIMTLKEWVLAN